MAVHASGIGHTLVTTTQQFPLGQIFERPSNTLGQGLEKWIYVQNVDAGDLAVGQVCMKATAAGAMTAQYTVEPTTATGTIPATRVPGVAQHVIAAGSFGFILKEGVGLVEVDDNNPIAGDALFSAGAGTNAGEAADLSTAFEHCHIGTVIVGAAGEQVTAFISCLG